MRLSNKKCVAGPRLQIICVGVYFRARGSQSSSSERRLEEKKVIGQNPDLGHFFGLGGPGPHDIMDGRTSARARPAGRRHCTQYRRARAPRYYGRCRQEPPKPRSLVRTKKFNILNKHIKEKAYFQKAKPNLKFGDLARSRQEVRHDAQRARA